MSEDPLDVIPSPVDPAYECVRRADDSAAPPDPGGPGESSPLCPPGYVPRLRRRPAYDLEGPGGKSVVADAPPEENPHPR